MSQERYVLEAQGIPIDCADTKLLYVSSAKFGDDWFSIMHTHACTEIFYVVSGSGQFKIEELTYPVSADDMIVVNPNVKHTELGRNGAPFEYIVLGIDGLDFTAGSEDEEDRFCVLNLHSRREDILHYLNSMLWELEHKSAGYVAICQNILEILLIHLMRRTDFALTPTQPGIKTPKSCVAARRYIDRHFKENISLEQLAKLSHFNKYYLVHAFSRQYGVSPINYLIDRRIEESKRLLIDTDHSLSQIANILGFSSLSYFSQSFRKFEGVSPMQYRKRQRIHTERA